MEELVKQLVKELIDASEAKWKLITIVEVLISKPELINDKDFSDELSEILQNCY